MNKLITFLILFTLVAANPPKASAQKSGETLKDTLCITTSGDQNQVIINSKNVTRINDCIDSLAVRGEIVQRGENNSITISTKGEAPKNKNQNSNKFQKPNSKTQTEPEIRRQADRQATSNKQHVTIKQSGKNNTVKINTQ